MRLLPLPALIAGILLSTPPGVSAQETDAFLKPGEPAPDFELAGATRYGVLAEPIRLSDFRGETVVLAFFYRARTPG
jgi:peroxiredoxin Q/BCP